MRHGVVRGGDNQRAFARGKVEYMCPQGGSLIDMNQHTAGGSDQVCVGVSDEHARV